MTLSAVGRRHLYRGRVTLWEAVAVALLAAALVVAAAWVLRVPRQLGHDEAVYALVARHWQAGTPKTGASAHRAPLLSALGVPVLALGGGDVALRGIAVGLAVATAVAVWWLGRMIAGPVAGLLGATVFAFSTEAFDAASLYLTDLPAAGLMVAATGVLWWQLGLKAQPDRGLLLVAPLTWAAYELRYGSASIIAVLFLVVAVLFRSSVRAHMRLVLQTAALLLLLLLAHLVNSTLTFGAPWDRLLITASISGREYMGEGLVDYVRWYPRALAGVHAAILMTVGLLGAPLFWWRSRRRAARVDDDERLLSRGLVLLLVPALGHAAAIGTTSHGEQRFVFYSVALLCTAGAVVATVVLRALSQSRAGLVVLGMFALAGVMAWHVARLAPVTAGERGDAQEGLAVFSEALRTLAELAGDDCSVLAGETPQVTWYTGCASYHFGSTPGVGREQQLSDDGWMLLLEGGRRQPEGAVLDYYRGIAEPVRSWHPAAESRYGMVTLYRITHPGEGGQAAEPPS